MKVCRDVDNNREKEWIEQVKKKLSHGHYFEGMIFIESKSLYVFTHELIHHIARLLRGYTQSRIFFWIDYLVDGFDIWLFNKE